MKIALDLVDGRQAVDYLAQVTVANAHGDPVMAAYHGPAGAIVAGHHREDGWLQFLEELGSGRVEGTGGPMRAKITPVKIGDCVTIVPAKRVIVYSDHGDPAIAAVAYKKQVEVAHAGDDGWQRFCDRFGIYIPRQAAIQEL